MSMKRVLCVVMALAMFAIAGVNLATAAPAIVTETPDCDNWWQPTNQMRCKDLSSVNNQPVGYECNTPTMYQPACKTTSPCLAKTACYVVWRTDEFGQYRACCCGYK